MKRIGVFLLSCLLVTQTVVAADGTAAESSAEKEAFELFVGGICNRIDGGGTTESLPPKIESVFSRYYSRIGKTEPTDPQEKIKSRVRFLNAHQNEIICSSDIICNNPASLCHDGMQYMKYALYTGNYKPLFEGVFIGSLVPDDLEVLIDFNAVSLSELGQPVTLIDYIEREIVAEKSKEEPYISYVIYIDDYLNMLTTSRDDGGFGAKRFNELPKDVGWNRRMSAFDQ